MPVRQRAITRSNDMTRPLLPRLVVQLTGLPRTSRSSACLLADPPGSCSSGALKSASRTSIHSAGFPVRPTQRLSPSPTYRTVPLKTMPAREGRADSHGSARAGAAKPAAARAAMIKTLRQFTQLFSARRRPSSWPEAHARTCPTSQCPPASRACNSSGHSSSN